LRQAPRAYPYSGEVVGGQPSVTIVFPWKLCGLVFAKFMPEASLAGQPFYAAGFAFANRPGDAAAGALPLRPEFINGCAGNCMTRSHRFDSFYKDRGDGSDIVGNSDGLTDSQFENPCQHSLATDWKLGRPVNEP
jgi:hypothetical protein